VRVSYAPGEGECLIDSLLSDELHLYFSVGVERLPAPSEHHVDLELISYNKITIIA
jgi:hypothetical protein